MTMGKRTELQKGYEWRGKRKLDERKSPQLRAKSGITTESQIKAELLLLIQPLSCSRSRAGIYLTLSLA